MKTLMALMLSVAAFVGPVHAQNAQALDQQAVATTAAPARGLLYKVQHEGRSAYLYGTIHVGKPEFATLGAQVRHALDASRKLVLEMDIRDQGAVQLALQQHGLYRDGDSLTRHVDAETYAQLTLTATRLGIQAESLNRMKPWLVANLLLATQLDRNGYHRQYGSEYLLLDAATGKALGELENAALQLGLFDSMDAATQEAYLREVLDEMEDGRALHKAGGLIDAWAAGDAARIELVSAELLNESSRSAEFTRRVLLDARNPRMADKVEQLLREEESSFVGVGMLHLLGEGGLPALLRARGYEVKRVY